MTELILILLFIFASFYYYLMINTKKKDFDTFSFRGKSVPRKDTESSKQDAKNSKGNNKIKNWRDMTYRFETTLVRSEKKPIPTYQAFYVNEKINKIDQELTDNIRRRIELQRKLYKEKRQQVQKMNDTFFKENNCKSENDVAKLYTNIQKKSDEIQNRIQRNTDTSYLNKSKYQSREGTRLQKSYLDSVQSRLSHSAMLPKKGQKARKYIIPDQLQVQKLIKAVTFPQIPQINLQKVQKRCEQLILNSQHSDLIYVMMAISFHLKKFHNVRKYFRQIQLYKVFELKAYWIACQAQFELQSFQLCLKLADKCSKQISDVHLPRFVYLQARCYQKIGNFVNSIVCYNQAIKMKPRVGQLYLERALIYDKIGYPIEAKQDYIEFSSLEPRARQILRQKIMIQKNEIKRKQLIKALAKLS